MRLKSDNRTLSFVLLRIYTSLHPLTCVSASFKGHSWVILRGCAPPSWCPLRRTQQRFLLPDEWTPSGEHNIYGMFISETFNASTEGVTLRTLNLGVDPVWLHPYFYKMKCLKHLYIHNLNLQTCIFGFLASSSLYFGTPKYVLSRACTHHLHITSHMGSFDVKQPFPFSRSVCWLLTWP